MKKNFWFDNKTGLYWEIKSLNDGDVNYCGDTYTFDEAKTVYTAKLNAAKYGGFDDWRIPNKDELRSIIDYDRVNPAVNTDIFVGCKPDDYWTENTYEMQPDFGWVLFFGFGSAIAKAKNTARYVIACRGQSAALFGVADKSRFTVNEDGTVLDSATGLMWQQGENSRMNFSSAVEYCKNMSLAGFNDWRLPTIKELNTILNLSYEGKWWYFKEAFPAEGLEPPLLHYLSGTTFQNHYAWVTNFCFGYDGYYASKQMPLLFRAVRDTKVSKQDFEYIGDGSAVIDNNTGLIWEKSQNPKESVFTWEQAKLHVEKLNESCFAGRSDWRLPTREELRTIVSYEGNSVPAIDISVFDDTVVDFYWASETKKDEPKLAWGIYFGYGCAICFPKENSYRVRAVCGDCCALETKFVDNGDGTVTDKNLNLMWMKEETPFLTLSEAQEYCKELRLGGYSDWKLPDIKELASLISLEEGNNGWFDSNFFPNIITKPQGFYLSSTIFGETFGWGVNFQFGYDGYYADIRNGKYPIKPVRKI